MKKNDEWKGMEYYRRREDRIDMIKAIVLVLFLYFVVPFLVILIYWLFSK